ncbi:hypothetical protein PQX77_006172 [Marasmius sp. AFHP31]|nr:hypothetical protein PQX77_006172 [Marasmius sp. AFHP31]
MAGEFIEIQKRVHATLSDDPHTWNELWKENLTPWDCGQYQPPLKKFLESEELNLPATGKALVPGCGTGYDAVLIGAVIGCEVLGLDISSSAVEKARIHLASQQDATLTSKVQFHDANFFDLNPSEDKDKYDLIYDYTFFVAIPPTLRPSWGTQMNKLVKPHGHLITLISPMDDHDEGGPPYYVRPEHYPEVLGDGWQKVHDQEPDNSLPRLIGKQRLVVWRKL